MVVYVTYTQSGVKKKAALNETKYQILANDPTIVNLVVHPSARLMEQNFNGASGKRILNG